MSKDKKYAVMFGTYSSAYAKPAKLHVINRMFDANGTHPLEFATEAEALEAIKTHRPNQQGYVYVYDVVQLIASVETKPVIETVVTRY